MSNRTRWLWASLLVVLVPCSALMCYKLVQMQDADQFLLPLIASILHLSILIFIGYALFKVNVIRGFLRGFIIYWPFIQLFLVILPFVFYMVFDELKIFETFFLIIIFATFYLHPIGVIGPCLSLGFIMAILFNNEDVDFIGTLSIFLGGGYILFALASMTMP